MSKSEDLKKKVEEFFSDLLDRFTKIDDLLRETNKLLRTLIERIERIEPKVYIQTGEKEIPLVVRPPINTSYDILEYDLSTARNDEPVGLRERGLVVYSVTVLQCDSEAYIKLNSKAHKPIPLAVGTTIENFRIEEIFVTNPSGSGKLILYIEWR